MINGIRIDSVMSSSRGGGHNTSDSVTVTITFNIIIIIAFFKIELNKRNYTNNRQVGVFLHYFDNKSAKRQIKVFEN